VEDIAVPPGPVQAIVYVVLVKSAGVEVLPEIWPLVIKERLAGGAGWLTQLDAPVEDQVSVVVAPEMI
jgi:hypothetical protein